MSRIVILIVAAFGCTALQPDRNQPSPAGRRDLFQLSELTMDVDAQTSVLGARKVDPKLYEASFYTKGVQCTSSLVGPRVLLTAAHCVAQGETLAIHVGGREVAAVCTQAPGFHPVTNKSPDYALCLTASDVTETPYFETINTDPARLALGQDVLLTGFGCTKAGGGGDTSGDVYRVGEAKVTTLPVPPENRFVTKGDAAVCYGDSGGPAFLQRIKDGGPRIQISVNAIGNNRDVSALASLSTPAAKSFLNQWSERHSVNICGIHPGQLKCRPFP